MTPQQERKLDEMMLEHVFGRPRPARDNRPWWVRLLSSLRLGVKKGSAQKPYTMLELKGKVDF
jgi:hypothetical protein